MEDIEWSHEVVQKTVIRRGYHMRKIQSLCPRAKELSDVDLNRSCVRGGDDLFSYLVLDNSKSNSNGNAFIILVDLGW